MPELSEADIGQLFGDSVCLYDGHPVKVVRAGNNMRILNLEHGKESTVKFDFNKFKALKSRLGFVNVNGVAFYAARTPSRNFSVGITQRNVKINAPNPGLYNRNAYHAAYDRVRKMVGKEWFDTIKGSYPNLATAIKVAVNTKGLCAFDRQFAIDCNRNVYYKLTKVGSLPERARSTNRVTFYKGCEHLELLLNPDYDKTVRIFG